MAQNGRSRRSSVLLLQASWEIPSAPHVFDKYAMSCALPSCAFTATNATRYASAPRHIHASSHAAGLLRTTKLCLRVDARHLPVMPVATQRDISSSSSVSSLTKLFVCDGAIDNPEAVATFLKTLFPKLDTVSMNSVQAQHEDGSAVPAELGELRTAWERVQELVSINAA